MWLQVLYSPLHPRLGPLLARIPLAASLHDPTQTALWPWFRPFPAPIPGLPRYDVRSRIPPLEAAMLVNLVEAAAE
jgi:hypothetical protein